MSIRDSFVERFGAQEAAAIEAAAELHRSELLEGGKYGSDPFRDAIVITIGFQCLSRASFRRYHGIKTPWKELREWIKTEAHLAKHDGPIDWLAYGAGLYKGLIK